ncbi:MAG: hypothetical protein Q9184_000325 [Pyrenodesmia sp. 2 TL-2023]
MARLSNLLRLEPFKLEELPALGELEPIAVPRSKSKQKQAVEDHHVGEDRTVASGAPSKVSETIRSEVSTFDADGRPAMRPFTKAILDQAVTFMDEIFPSSYTPFAERLSPPSRAKVQLLKRDRNPPWFTKIPWGLSKVPRDTPHHLNSMGEGWFARKSHHANRQEKGTARFSEFDYGLRVEHCEHEGQYTPQIFDTYKVLECELQQESPDEDGSTAGDYANFVDYKDVSMSIYEMCHKLPSPLSTRVFPVLVVTARTGKNAFIVVQRPVDIESHPEAFYSNGRNLQEGDSYLKRKKPVLGSVKHGSSPLMMFVVLIVPGSVYTSIERCVLTENDEIEWTMATTSDAKGWLPKPAQKMGVPGAIVKDVGFFMKWIEEERVKRSS